MRDRERDLARVAVSHPDERMRAAAAATWLRARGIPVDARSVVAVASDVSSSAAEAVLADADAHGWIFVGSIARRAGVELDPGSLEPFVDVVSPRA